MSDAPIRRAYSVLTIKSVDAEQRILTGIATTPSTDSYGDVVEPGGAEFNLPIPLLYQHDSRQPIGKVIDAKTTKGGITVKAQIAKIDEPGQLKDRLDMAWQSIKAGLVAGLSIGFRSLEESYDKESGGFHFLRWQWLELSAVTIPANMDCSIQTIRSLDVKPTATGQPPVVRSTSGVSDRPKPSMKKPLTEQLKTWQNERAAKVAQLDALIEKSGESGVVLTAEESDQHDTLEAEVKEIDKQIVRIESAIERDKKAAKPVAGTEPFEASQSRSATVVSVTDRLEKGQLFARYAMLMTMAKGSESYAIEMAKENYFDNAPGLIKMIKFGGMSPIQREAMQLAAQHQKAAVGGAATSVSGWASELVPYNIMDDFINFLRPQTILGKFGTNVAGVQIPALRRVPFNTRVTGFSAGLTANWVGEGLPATLSKATSFTTSLTWSKLAALAVLTKEEIRFSNPNAELKVRDDIAAALIQKMDKDFIDPSKNASANVSPASITNQTTPILTTGTTATQLRTDLATLLATFTTLNFSLDDIVLILSTTDALNISLMVSSLGVPLFPGLTMQGGYLVGVPCITTTAMVSIGSPISNIIVAVKAGDIYLADDGVVTVDASDQASVEMVDTSSQSGVTGTGASLVSFWQDGLLGLKATREVNWKLRRTGAARYIYNSLYKA